MSDFTRFDAFGLAPGERTYRLERALAWDIGREASGWSLEIEAGACFDISVPRWLKWAQSPDDRRVLPAAAIHDELLRKGHDVAFAAAEFRRACIARGVHPRRAWLLFLAVLIWTATSRTHRD